MRGHASNTLCFNGGFEVCREDIAGASTLGGTLLMALVIVPCGCGYLASARSTRAADQSLADHICAVHMPQGAK